MSLGRQLLGGAGIRGGCVMSFVSRISCESAVIAKHGVVSIYDWHKELWKLFPDMPDVRREYLFRIDRDESEVKCTVLSKHQPIRPDWCPESNWLSRTIDPEYLSKREYLFKMYVNPTRSTRKNSDGTAREKKNARHEAILKMPELREWIARKAEQNGFRLLEHPELEISPPIMHRLEKEKKGNECRGTIFGVDFKGALEVADKELFQKAVEEGVGKARRFGFGLLILKPII